MAMANSTEFYSDLRGTEQDKKRERDHDAKWKNGPTIKGTHCGQTCLRLGTSTPGGMDMILARNTEAGIKTHWKPHKMEDRRQHRPTVANMYKPRGPSSGMAPTGRIRSFVSVQEELRNDAAASLIDLLPAQRTGHGTVFDGVSNTPVYGDGTSEASAGPPSQPLTLDFFVVESARGTEKMVEKEYEVLDANGEKVRGRKVRQVLRGAKNKGDGKTGNDEVPTVEDDGFELV